MYLSDIKIIFMGTPKFALPSLEGLLENYKLEHVVTQPDRPRGRGKKVVPSPVKEFAITKGLNCFQPEKVKDSNFLEQLAAIKPDLIVTAAYGQILSKELLAIPSLGSLNVHPSLLPLYRGAAPIQRTIMAGDKETGVTIYYMDEGMDSGEIILQEKTVIKEGETAGELHDRLSYLGVEILLKAIELITDNRASSYPQDHNKATYAAPITREEEEIDWLLDGKTVTNKINGLSPNPGAFTYFRGKRLKIFKANFTFDEGKKGTVIEVLDDGFVVGTNEGSVFIGEVQPAGKKIMTASAFIRGYNLDKGYKFASKGVE